MSKKAPYKLSYPYSYYWKRYVNDMKCPFCKSDIEYTDQNYDIVYCKAYDGYLTIYADTTYSLGDGECQFCMPSDPLDEKGSWSIEEAEKTSPHRMIVKDDMFLCEHCHHGVIFTNPPKMVQELFNHTDTKEECKHCKWHEDHIEKGKTKIKGFKDF